MKMVATGGTSYSDETALALGSTLHRTAEQIYLDDHKKRIHDDIETTTKRLELEKRRLNKLEQDVERTRSEHQEKVLKIKLKGSSRKEEKDHKKDDVVPVRKLEHRKMQAVAQLDALESENKEIRAKIDSTRRERLQMNQIFKKLQTDIKENIQQVTHLQRDTDAARHEQEERQNRVLALKKLLDRERKEFKAQVDSVQSHMSKSKKNELKAAAGYRELTITIRKSAGQVLGFKVKGPLEGDGVVVKEIQTGGVLDDWNQTHAGERVNVGDRVVSANGAEGDAQKILEEMRGATNLTLVIDRKDPEGAKKKTGHLMADEESQFKSQDVMRRILKLAFLNAIQRRHIKQHQKNIEVFEQAFLTIKSTTGISDIEEIVKIFVALEQRNFSLLTYVNMLNREIETFEKSNRELEDQLLSRKRHEEQSDKARNDALTDKKQQIKNTQKVTEENQQQAMQQAEIVDRCKPLIQGILKTVEKENRGFGGPSAPELTGENILSWLTYIEKTLTQWKDFLPDTKDARHSSRTQPNKNYKYTVGNQVLQLQPKKHTQNPEKLVRANDLPLANLEQGGQQRGALAGREEDNSDEEEDLESQVWTWQELRDKAVASVAKRKKHRKADQPGQQLTNAGPEQGKIGDAEASLAVGEGAAQAELGYEDIIAGAEKPKTDDDDSNVSNDSDLDDDIGPTDEEINEIFLKRYKMTKEELQGMADKMRIQLNNLCYLKQEFDNYDEDRSGYIDVKELKGLLQKLGEELSDDELDQAFRELDSDGSGEIEFFEFVEWFTSED